MRVENMKTDNDGNTSARIYLQASRTPKTSDALKRAISWERSVRKAFEYRGWIVDSVRSINPVDDSPSILDVIVTLRNDERVDALRECRRWNTRTQAERVVNAIYNNYISIFDARIQEREKHVASKHNKRSALYSRLFAE